MVADDTYQRNVLQTDCFEIGLCSFNNGSDRSRILLAGSDTIDFVDRHDKHLAIAHLTRMGCFADGLDRPLHKRR